MRFAGSLASVVWVGMVFSPRAFSESAGWRHIASEYPCSEAVVEQMRAWDALEDSFRAPPTIGAPDAVRLRIPTKTLGEWVLLDEVASDRAPRLTLVQLSGATRVTIAKDCSPRTRVVSSEQITAPSERRSARGAEATGSIEAEASSGSAAPPLTDASLSRLLKAGPVVVYVWSPHMPLSVDGYREVRDAAEGLAVSLVPVLVPASDPRFAAEVREEAEIPRSGLAEASSLELVYRNALVHAPTVIVFTGSRVSPPMPGYRNAKGYRDFLEEFLSSE